MTKREFRNSLWELSQRERATALLERVREQQSRAHATGYGRAADALTDRLHDAR